MSDVSSTLQSIKDKVNKLNERHVNILDEKKQLQEKNQQLEELVRKKEEQISELNERIKVLQTAKSLTGDEENDNKEGKKRLDNMIREVDKCIALMNE